MAAAVCDLGQWEAWKAKYKKQYTAAEDESRFQVFCKKLDTIAELSKRNPMATFGPGPFADLTTGEFKSLNGFRAGERRRANTTEEDKAPRMAMTTVPTNWISTGTTAAQDQGQCGSCWAFASCGVTEAAYKLATSNTVTLSPQQLVDCSSGSGCNGGNYDNGLGYFVSKQAATMSQYAYVSGSSGSATSCSMTAGTSGVQLSKYPNVAWDETVGGKIETALYQYGPMGLAMDATTVENYQSGILTDSGCETGVDHAVLLVGWMTYQSTPVWIVKNSWGSSWGIVPDSTTGWTQSLGGGFFYIVRDTTNSGSSQGTCMMGSWGGYYGVVVGGSTCTAKTKTAACGTTTTCGSVSDGCSGTISCGTCSTGYTCTSGSCVASCTAKTTTAACGTATCGSVSNGCSGTISCGTCTSTQTCSSGTCTSSCTPTASTTACGSYKCGNVSNGCGGTYSCGTCSSSTVCSSGACVTPSSCTPLTTTKACGTATCGTVSNGCSGTLSCGTCSSSYTCVSGTCISSCTPLSQTSACGSSVCGSVSNSCGGSITCGTCASTQTCTSGKCATPSPSAVTWTQFLPSGSTTDFTVSGTNVYTATTTTTEKRTKWVNSASLMNVNWVSISAVISATAAGTVGLGTRLGQTYGTTDCLSWKVSIPSATGKSTISKCSTLQGKETCTAAATWTYTLGSSFNLTVVFQNAVSGSTAVVSMTPYVAGKGIYSSALSTSGTTTFSMSPQSYWANVGSAFLIASGGGKTFANPTITTRSAVTVGATDSHTTTQVAAYAARILGVPIGTFINVTGTTPGATAGTYKGFLFTIADSAVNQFLGLGVAPHTVPNFQTSHELASQLSSIMNTGNSELAGFSITSAAITAIPVVGSTATITTAASVGLSVGAIIGIAIGSAAGAALLLSAAGAGIYAATRPEPEQPMPEDFQPHNPFRKTFYKIKVKKGVDVINMNPKDHQSITGRAPPVAL